MTEKKNEITFESKKSANLQFESEGAGRFLQTLNFSQVFIPTCNMLVAFKKLKGGIWQTSTFRKVWERKLKTLNLMELNRLSDKKF